MLSRSPSPDFDPSMMGIDFAPLPQYIAASDTNLDFGGLLSAPLRVHEDRKSGCGGQTWPAGVVLARHMLRYHREGLKTARILEIGAGGGLVGLAVENGCKPQHPLYITDQLEMLELMGHNIVLNEAEGRVKAMILNWGESLPAEIQRIKPDVILAADCAYHEPSFPLLLQTLKDLLALCPSATVYFCFMNRRRADKQFIKNARKSFVVTEVADDDRPVFSRVGLFLLTFTSKERPADALTP